MLEGGTVCYIPCNLTNEWLRYLTPFQSTELCFLQLWFQSMQLNSDAVSYLEIENICLHAHVHGMLCLLIWMPAYLISQFSKTDWNFIYFQNNHVNPCPGFWSSMHQKYLLNHALKSLMRASEIKIIIVIIIIAIITTSKTREEHLCAREHD